MAARRTGQEADPDLRDALEMQRAQQRQGPAVRRVAQQWADGLKTVLGATGVVGIFGAPIAVGNLGAPTRLLVGLLLALVVVFGVVALLLVMSAAYGGTREVPVPQRGFGLLELRTLEAQRALRHFRWGRRFTVASLLLMAVAVGVAWMDPVSPDDDTTVVVTTERGVERCGRLVAGADDHVGIDASGGRTLDVPFDDVVSLVTVESCPGND